MQRGKEAQGPAPSLIHTEKHQAEDRNIGEAGPHSSGREKMGRAENSVFGGPIRRLREPVEGVPLLLLGSFPVHL